MRDLKSDDDKVQTNILDTFRNKDKSPHSLIELSMREHQRMTDNIIHLSGMKRIHGHVLYDSFKFGKNIRFKNTNHSSKDDTFETKELLFTKIKANTVYITVDKKEALDLYKNLIITSSRSNQDPSGILIVCCSMFKAKKLGTKIWGMDDYKRLERCKPNITKCFSHFGSSGNVYSFGNKGSFDKATLSSVGQYSSKKSKIERTQLCIERESEHYERMVSEEINVCMEAISKVVPKVRSVINPIVETAFKIQSDEIDLNIKSGHSSKHGCWHTSICINAETEQFHTEDDCCYTLICVPNQIFDKNMKRSNRYDFIFKLTDQKNMSITLSPGSSFFFSGMYLTHRQNRTMSSGTKDDSHFFNIASYGNKRLFSHIRTTLKKMNN